MFLHYFKKKVSKDNSLSNYIYLEILRLVEIFFEKNQGNLKKNFNTSYELFSIFLFVILYGSKINKKNYSKFNQELMNRFIDDLDFSMRELGISDIKISKYVKVYVKKFYYRISNLEKIFKKKDYFEFENYFKNLNILYDFDLYKPKNEILYKELNKIIEFIDKEGVNRDILLDILI